MQRVRRFQSLLHPPTLVWEYGLTALVLAAMLAQGCAALVREVIPQKYSQLVVSDITWNAGTKYPDYLVLGIFLVGFLTIYLGLRQLSAAIHRVNGESVESALRQLLIYAMLPAGIWVGSVCIVNNPSLDLVILSGVLLLLVLLFAGVVLRSGVEFTSGDGPIAAIGSSLLVILFALLDAVAIALAVSRLHLGWSLRLNSVIWGATGLALIFTLCLIGVWWRYRHRPPTLLKKLGLLLGLAQFGLPLCFFILLPTPWRDQQHKFYGYAMTPALGILIAVCILAALIDLTWRIRGFVTDENRSPLRVVSPLCLVALLLLIKAPVAQPSIIPTDDYHWGEFLLPWWLWQEFGYIPFRDYEPARGLVNYVPGMLANLFMNGNAASYIAIQGQPLLMFPFLGIGFFVIASTIGYLPAFLALLLFPGANGLFEIDVLVTSGLCILVSTFLKRRPITWLWLWLTTVSLMVTFGAGNGGLLMLATIPLAAVMLYRAWFEQRQRLLPNAIALIVGGSVVLLTPAGSVLVGAFRYGIEQSSLNTLSYGIEWVKSRGSQTFLSYPLWELVRTSWIVASCGIGLLIYRALLQKKTPERQQFLVFAIPIFLLTLLIITRASGRIDPGEFTRLGNASLWVICLLLPILLIKAFGQSGRALNLLVVAILGGLLTTAAGRTLSLDRVARQPVNAVNVTGLKFLDGQQAGLPKLNGGVTDPTHLQRLQTIHSVLQPLLQPGETYLDLTNRNAHYFYLGYPPPIATTAFFNLVHKNQQLRAVHQLEKSTPPVVLASADSLIFDHVPVALRSHLLYRYVIQRYVPFAVGHYIFLIRPDRLAQVQRLAQAGTALPPIVMGNTEERQLQLLDQAFRSPDIASVPSAWGRSMGSLRREIQPVAAISESLNPTLENLESLGSGRYRSTGPNPSIIFDLTALGLSGRDAGLLAFDFACKKRTTAMSLRWEGQFPTVSQENVLSFKAMRGQQLVPLDAAPRWLLAQGIKTIRIEILEPTCSEFSLANVSLYQRRDAAQANLR